MSKRNAISYIKNEPAFITKFKEKIGHKEEPDKAKMPDFDTEDDDQLDKDDEKPVVVVLKKGDLTAEEADAYQTTIDTNATEEPPADGKITFKKPEKRSNETVTDLNVSSSKKKKESTKCLKSNSKKVNNKTLLSFGDEEDEDT